MYMERMTKEGFTKNVTFMTPEAAVLVQGVAISVL